MAAQGNRPGERDHTNQSPEGADRGCNGPIAIKNLPTPGVLNQEPSLGHYGHDPLHRYLATVMSNLGCHPVSIDSTEDHIHILFELARTVPVSKVVEDVKKSSSRWLKTQPGVDPGFAWQSGYGVFSVSVSNLEAVRDYVTCQREHHRKHSFQDELRVLLERHGVEYDERYLWD